MLYLNSLKYPHCSSTYNLTLTSVVFEFNTISNRSVGNSYLTLTSVVFELFANKSFGVISIDLTLTSVVFESYACENGQMERVHLTFTSVVFECHLLPLVAIYILLFNFNKCCTKKAVTKRISQCYSFFY